MNQLYYGDNLDVLRLYIKDETVDLVYLDPPFKSNQDYNVLFAEKDGADGSPLEVRYRFERPRAVSFFASALDSPKMIRLLFAQSSDW